ncbi:F-box domain-containing protein [Mycena chlorophos]|uniref:F-box domain-containing protein n=1 Tax=Mycena chlorophos TaxID=658473 RepID=A0A8H6TNC8_MYCCL|nr:F-box domain-containing protein [Mycena chlorophos]
MDLDELIRTNLPPLAAQASELRRILHAKIEDTARLEEEHTTAVAAVADLNARLALAKRDILALQGTLSPLRQLPTEVMAEIFTIFVRQEQKISTWSTSSEPMILSRVCSRWRTIALSTPRLWTKLLFTLTPSNHWRRFVAMEELFQRSRSFQVDLVLTENTPLHRAHLSVLSEILRSPHFVDRVHSLETRLDRAHFLQAAGVAQPGSVPLVLPTLNTLHIVASNEKFELHDCFPAFGELPGLRDLTISLPPLSPPPKHGFIGSFPDFPWSKMTSLRWELSLDARTIHWLLAQMSCVERVAFSFIRVYNPSPAQGPQPLPAQVIVPNLTDLTIHAASSIRYPLLQALVLPKLKVFSVRGIKSPSRQTPFDILSDLQQRSGFSLTRLTLCGSLEMQFVPAFLALLPALTELHIKRQDSGVYAALSQREALNPTSDTPLLVPNLKNLRVSMRNDGGRRAEAFENQGRDLVEMLAWRCRSAPVENRLQKVTVRIPGDRSALLGEWAQALLEELTAEAYIKDPLKSEA